MNPSAAAAVVLVVTFVATRVALVKSPLRSCSRNCLDEKLDGGAASTIAPCGIRPAVG